MRPERRRPITFRVRWEIDIEAPSRATRMDLLAVEGVRVEPADVLLATVEAFPGLIDGKTDVSGGDLVEFLTTKLRDLTHLDDIVPEADRRTQS